MSLRPFGLAAVLLALGAAPAIADPPRPAFREPIPDYRGQELTLTYAFGPGSIDFAPLPFMSVGVGVDQVFGAQSWLYRTTLKLVDNPGSYQIGLNAAATHIRERLAGDTFTAPTWGYQGGILVALPTESGLTFRAGIQMYDTDWSGGAGPQVLLTPEIAYSFSLAEVTLVPGWPLNAANWTWVGLRVRL